LGRLGLIGVALLMVACPKHVAGVAAGPAGACTWKMDAYDRACVAGDRLGSGEWETRKLLCGSDAYLCGERRTCHCVGEGISCPKAAGVRVSFKRANCRVSAFPPVDGMCSLVGDTIDEIMPPDEMGELPFGSVETDMCGHRFSCNCASFVIPDEACDASLSQRGDHCQLRQPMGEIAYERSLTPGASATVCGKTFVCAPDGGR
jgi:hypothetical protein